MRILVEHLWPCICWEPLPRKGPGSGLRCSGRTSLLFCSGLKLAQDTRIRLAIQEIQTELRESRQVIVELLESVPERSMEWQTSHNQQFIHKWQQNAYLGKAEKDLELDETPEEARPPQQCRQAALAERCYKHKGNKQN